MNDLTGFRNLLSLMTRAPVTYEQTRPSRPMPPSRRDALQRMGVKRGLKKWERRRARMQRYSA
jgi:hypothetical protein